MAKKLEVRNLTISFRTNNGAVRAVRDVSFDLNEGETLAIAGESGSGKSVTTRAVMGILAGNAIVENGEIIYDGKDLLKISEDDFHTLRGHKLSMVFQDPLSALNPIMKIGKQLTEAMILNNKERRRDGKTQYRRMLKLLEENMLSCGKCGSAAGIKALLADYHSAGEQISAAMSWSDEKTAQARKSALQVLQGVLPVFEAENLNEKQCREAAKKASAAVDGAIDPLALEKDNSSYVFRSSISANLDRYFKGLRENPKEEKRYAKDCAEHDKKVKAGKFAPSAVPMNLIDVQRAKSNCQTAVKNLISSYEARLSADKNRDYAALARDMIAYLDARKEDMERVLTENEAKEHAIELMKEVGIPQPEKRYDQYRFEFSGGMRQRIVIAIALSANPDILICDEPTTALDVTIQAQILELINRLKRERRLSVIFITHDLGVVANMADRIAIMYAGKIVEYGTADDVFYDPRHPYTWALLSSMPDLETKEKLEAIPGTPPDMIIPPVGDAFAARNKYAMQIDFEQQPPMFRVSDTHQAATWLLHPDAPKVEPPQIVQDRIRRMKNKQYDTEKGGERS